MFPYRQFYFETNMEMFKVEEETRHVSVYLSLYLMAFMQVPLASFTSEAKLNFAFSSNLKQLWTRLMVHEDIVWAFM